ncbi:MAG: sugar phosphate isomerase/epimerase [Anaerolineales bacterium]|nr:sugar phosphate isomerase/epimerase [Chloroflexota bacterium]MBL6980630.1 sugar phosphate isomerase/epimerase [Anaerolineales bacterium]
MRFGIHAFQLEALIPPGLSPEEVLAHITNFEHIDLIRPLFEKGFNPIELGGDLNLFLPQTYSPSAIEKLINFKAETGIGYTLHLPLWSVETSTPQTPVRKGSIQAIIDCIRVTKPLEPEVYVLHATGALAAEFYRMNLPDIAKILLLRQFQGSAAESMRTILAETGIPSRKLAIETIEFPFELTLELAQDLDLSLCLDTGHVLVGFSGPIEFFDALEQCLPRLAEIHLHDGPWQGPQMKIGYGKDHQALGMGDLDVGRLLDRLRETNFEGPIIFELSLQQALESLQVIGELRPDILP